MRSIAYHRFSKTSRFSKKAVSPVIGVILLIALTVAMVAIVWGMVSSYMTVQPLVTVEIVNVDYNNSTGVGVVNGIIHVNVECSITFELSNATHTISDSGGVLSHTGLGDQAFSATFNPVSEASYDLVISITYDSGNLILFRSLDFS